MPLETRFGCLEPAFCICSFFLENSLHWQRFEKYLVCTTEKAIDLLTSHEAKKNHVIWEEPTMASFTEQYQWIMDSIQNDEIKKAVPYVIESGKTKDGESLQALSTPIASSIFSSSTVSVFAFSTSADLRLSGINSV